VQIRIIGKRVIDLLRCASRQSVAQLLPLADRLGE
jgi:hypothetical protein